jgi:hypothetical protein
MLKKLFMLAAVGLLMIPATADAGFVFGDRTFSLMGSGQSDRKFDNTDFAVEAAVGYFWMSNMEASLRQNLTVIQRDVGGTDFRGSTRVAADLYFPLNNFNPFIGVNFGAQYGDNIRDQFVIGPEIGFKHFLNDTTYLAALVEYQVLFRSARDVDDQFRHGLWSYSLGLGFRF